MDMDKLQSELDAMVKADDLYWQKNEAKCRAAKDNVSYEEFEKRVKVTQNVLYKWRASSRLP